MAQADWHRLCLCLWNKHNLSQWDRQIGTSCAYPSGTSTACPNWDWERSKETSPCPTGQVIYPRWRPFLVPGQAILYPRWSLSQFHLSQLVPQSGSTRPWNSCAVNERRPIRFPTVNKNSKNPPYLGSSRDSIWWSKGKMIQTPKTFYCLEGNKFPRSAVEPIPCSKMEYTRNK